jgi:predicted RNase H-like HicB family nuclease
MQQSYQVNAFWDADVGVWVATSDDIPGLATEADTIETLSQKLRTLIPELLFLNGVISQNYAGSIAFELVSHRQEQIEVAS